MEERVKLVCISFLRYWVARYGKVISKRDDFVVDTLFYFEPVQRFEYRVISLVLGFRLLREQGSFAVAGEEKFVFAVS